MKNPSMMTVYEILGSRSDLFNKTLAKLRAKHYDQRLSEIRRIFEAHDKALEDHFLAHPTDPPRFSPVMDPMEDIAIELIGAQVRGQTKKRALPGFRDSEDNPTDGLAADMEKMCELSGGLKHELRVEAENMVRQVHPGPLPIDKDKDLQNFLIGAAGPIPFKGPSDVHEVDEVFARVHARAPWLRRATSRIWRAARAHAKNGDVGLSIPPTCLHGPPGTGKTMLAQIISEEAGAPYHEMDASAGASGFRLSGTEAGWSNRMIGEPLRFIGESITANPTMVINEIDKSTGGLKSTGGVSTSLVHSMLPLLDRNSAKAFRCPASGLVCDMSRINWILTANDLSLIPGPLQTRVEIIEVPALTLRDFIEASEVMCPDDPEALEAVQMLIIKAYKSRSITLRHIARAIEIATATEEQAAYH